MRLTKGEAREALSILVALGLYFVATALLRGWL